MGTHPARRDSRGDRSQTHQPLGDEDFGVTKCRPSYLRKQQSRDRLAVIEEQEAVLCRQFTYPVKLGHDLTPNDAAGLRATIDRLCALKGPNDE